MWQGILIPSSVKSPQLWMHVHPVIVLSITSTIPCQCEALLLFIVFPSFRPHYINGSTGMEWSVQPNGRTSRMPYVGSLNKSTRTPCQTKNVVVGMERWWRGSNIRGRIYLIEVPSSTWTTSWFTVSRATSGGEKINICQEFFGEISEIINIFATSHFQRRHKTKKLDINFKKHTSKGITANVNVSECFWWHVPLNAKITGEKLW